MPIYNHELLSKETSEYKSSGLTMPGGAVFYASLNGNTPSIAETDQLLNTTGSITYQSIDGIKCGYFDGNSFIRFDGSNFSYGQDFSVSFWINCNISDKQRAVFSFGTNEANKAFAVMMYTDGRIKTIGTNNANNEWTSNSNVIISNKWNFVTVVNHTTYEDIFVNGSKIGTFNYSRNITSSGYGYIGCLVTDLNWNIIGYVSSVRFYNRSLSDLEIETLFHEFIPKIEYSSTNFEKEYRHPIEFYSAKDSGNLLLVNEPFNCTADRYTGSTGERADWYYGDEIHWWTTCTRDWPISNGSKVFWVPSSTSLSSDDIDLHGIFGAQDYWSSSEFIWTTGKPILVKGYQLVGRVKFGSEYVGSSSWYLKGSNDLVNWDDINFGSSSNENLLEYHSCSSNNTKYLYHKFVPQKYTKYSCFSYVTTFYKDIGHVYLSPQ